MTFSWAGQKLKVRKKFILRTQILAMVNPDFRIAHPNLVKEVETGTSDVEIKKYCNDICDKHFKYGKTPEPSIKIKRMNRVV